jgi:hypothetical protein
MRDLDSVRTHVQQIPDLAGSEICAVKKPD